MKIEELLFRFIVGGSIIVFISLLSETRYKTLSGLIVLFPAVTATGYYFATQTMSIPELQTMSIFSIIALPTLGSFFIGFYYALNHYNSNTSIVIGILFWFISSAILIVIDYYYLNLT